MATPCAGSPYQLLRSKGNSAVDDVTRPKAVILKSGCDAIHQLIELPIADALIPLNQCYRCWAFACMRMDQVTDRPGLLPQQNAGSLHLSPHGLLAILGTGHGRLDCGTHPAGYARSVAR